MRLDEANLERRGLARLAVASDVAALRQDMLSRVPQFASGDPKQVAVLGTGPEGQRFVETCDSRRIEVVGVFDGNARKRGLKCAGRPILPSEALTRLPRSVPVVIASHRTLGACEGLRAQGFAAVPLPLLQVAVPERYVPHVFYGRLLEDLFDNREKIAALERSLADEQSRRTLDAVVAFRLTMDPVELREVIDWDLYGASGLVPLGPEETYVDGGAFDGDSIQMFIEHVGGRYTGIYAFEPDRETFARLTARFGAAPRVELLNAGLFSRSGRLGFAADGSRAARIDASGSGNIQVFGLDDVLRDKPVTYIKMNIEGAEIDALAGAEKAIRRWAPKLAISVYHRPSDLWHIAEIVRWLRPDYRLYLRQHDGGLIETVLYALPAASARVAA